MAFANWKNRKQNKQHEAVEVKDALPPAHADFPHLMPVDTYVDTIMARSEVRGWKFTQGQADDLSAQLEGLDHLSSRAPVGVSMWLGRNLAYNWHELQMWLGQQARRQGYSLITKHLDPTGFYPGSEMSGEPSLTAVGLNLPPWENPSEMYRIQIRTTQPRWPSLEVPLMLCLNPRMIRGIRQYMPLMAPGLVDGSDPAYFSMHSGKYFYAESQRNYRDYDMSVVIEYRDL